MSKGGGKPEQVALPPHFEFHRVRRRYAKAVLSAQEGEEGWRGQVSDRRRDGAARSKPKQERKRSQSSTAI